MSTTPPAPMITLDAVAKGYGSTRALGPVDLEIAHGGITALVGPNGAGKSTMLTIIGRLLGADAGAVRVGGLDVATAKPRELAKVVSILKQENHFVARLTVRQLVAFGRFPHSQGRLAASDHEAIDEAVAFLDLAHLEHRFLDELSGGQRQRAFVAMVLAQDTEVLLLDEPLSNLDMRHAARMMQQLRDAADVLGKTIVLVVHDVNFASVYADRIIALADGEIVASGTPDEIMRPEVLSRVFDTPVDVVEHAGQRLAVYYRPVPVPTGSDPSRSEPTASEPTRIETR